MNQTNIKRPDFYTTSGVARALGVAESTVRKMHRDGVLPAQLGSDGRRMFQRADIERVLADRARMPPEA